MTSIDNMGSLESLTRYFSEREVFADTYFTRLRWPRQISCPECACELLYVCGEVEKNTRIFKCEKCHAAFSLRSGTFFQDSKISLSTWFGLIWLLLEKPEGVPSTELARRLNITQKTAWWCLNQLRAVVKKNRSGLFRGPLQHQKSNSNGVPRPSPLPAGLAFDDVLKRLITAKPLPKNSIRKSQRWLTESGRPARRSSRESKHREVFYAYPT